MFIFYVNILKKSIPAFFQTNLIFIMYLNTKTCNIAYQWPSKNIVQVCYSLGKFLKLMDLPVQSIIFAVKIMFCDFLNLFFLKLICFYCF